MERACGVPVGGRELRIPEASLLVSAVGWPLAVRVPRGSVVLQCYCMPGATSSTCDPAHLQDDSVRAFEEMAPGGGPPVLFSRRLLLSAGCQRCTSCALPRIAAAVAALPATSTITNLFYCHHYLVLTRLVLRLVHSLTRRPSHSLAGSLALHSFLTAAQRVGWLALGVCSGHQDRRLRVDPCTTVATRGTL